MKKLAFAALTALLTASSCFAEVRSYQNGNELLADCTSNKHPERRAFCIGYAEGVVDSLELTRQFTGVGTCVRLGVTGGQIMDVIKYLREHPETRDNGAAGLVVSAVAASFCPGDDA